jgi:trimeric autotransporter adhesin
VITDTEGNLYGAAATGGLDATQNSLGSGTVFELAPCDPNDSWQPCWTETTIYSFCSDGGTNCTDGQHPGTGLLRDPVGSLYGTTSAGGSHGAGTVFTLAVPSFVLAGASVSVDPGATTDNTSTITLYPRGGFTGKVTLAAAITSKPSGAQELPTLSLASNSVSITGSSAVKVILTINTTAPTDAALEHSARPGVRWHTGGMTLAFGLIFGIGICIPTRGRTRRTRLGSLLFLVIFASGLLSCSAGSGSGTSGNTGNSSPGTTPGAYIATVTGTSGSITATSTVTLTVQ